MKDCLGTTSTKIMKMIKDQKRIELLWYMIGRYNPEKLDLLDKKINFRDSADRSQIVNVLHSIIKPFTLDKSPSSKFKDTMIYSDNYHSSIVYGVLHHGVDSESWEIYLKELKKLEILGDEPIKKFMLPHKYIYENKDAKFTKDSDEYLFSAMEKYITDEAIRKSKNKMRDYNWFEKHRASKKMELYKKLGANAFTPLLVSRYSTSKRVEIPVNYSTVLNRFRLYKEIRKKTNIDRQKLKEIYGFDIVKIGEDLNMIYAQERSSRVVLYKAE